MSTATTSRGSAVPGSVKVIGRRQIEIYSRLIHTVDHVEGELRGEFDALDGFLSHAWAVTVTGAPKLWAIRFIEQQERSSRRWYGGAIGRVTFDGNMNTGLTLRTIRMKDGVGEVRAGATLLFDSDPQAEEAECRLKASALFAAIRGRTAAAAVPTSGAARNRARPQGAAGRPRGFVRPHAGQLYPRDRCAGRDDALRPGARRIERRGDLRSRGPVAGAGAARRFRDRRDAWPRDPALASRFSGSASACKASSSISAARSTCSGTPMHGKPSAVRVLGGRLLRGLPAEFTVGRYHSLHARRAALPPSLTVTAETVDGVIMAIEHVELPIAAVQFHPEFGHDLGAADRHADHRVDVCRAGSAGARAAGPRRRRLSACEMISFIGSGHSGMLQRTRPGTHENAVRRTSIGRFHFSWPASWVPGSRALPAPRNDRASTLPDPPQAAWTRIRTAGRVCRGKFRPGNWFAIPACTHPPDQPGCRR